MGKFFAAVFVVLTTVAALYLAWLAVPRGPSEDEWRLQANAVCEEHLGGVRSGLLPAMSSMQLMFGDVSNGALPDVARTLEVGKGVAEATRSLRGMSAGIRALPTPKGVAEGSYYLKQVHTASAAYANLLESAVTEFVAAVTYVRSVKHRASLGPLSTMEVNQAILYMTAALGRFKDIFGKAHQAFEDLAYAFSVLDLEVCEGFFEQAQNAEQ